MFKHALYRIATRLHAIVANQIAYPSAESTASLARMTAVAQYRFHALTILVTAVRYNITYCFAGIFEGIAALVNYYTAPPSASIVRDEVDKTVCAYQRISQNHI